MQRVLAMIALLLLAVPTAMAGGPAEESACIQPFAEEAAAAIGSSLTSEPAFPDDSPALVSWEEFTWLVDDVYEQAHDPLGVRRILTLVSYDADLWEWRVVNNLVLKRYYDPAVDDAENASEPSVHRALWVAYHGWIQIGPAYECAIAVEHATFDEVRAVLDQVEDALP